MTEPLDFNFPIPLLLKDGDTIITTAEAFAARLVSRVDATYIAEARVLIGAVTGADADKQGAVGDVGNLTLAQSNQLQALLKLITAAKKTAKKAFRGQDVKLREEFQIGINKPVDLGSVLQRARIVSASMKKADHLAPLKSKGWIATDTAKIDAAIESLKTADQTQETAKSDKLDTTGGRNHDANDLFDHLETIQNAADLEFPEDDPANTGIRAKFLLGKFPPPHTGGSDNAPILPPMPTLPTK